jgi:hypothetical protein
VAAALARFVSPDGRTAQYIAVEPGGKPLPITQVPAVRTILVPALVTRLGRWNWWPSTLWPRDAATARFADGLERA